MTEAQAQELIDLMEQQNLFISDYFGHYTVELFNTVTYYGIFACSILLGLLVINIFSKRQV